MNDRTDDRALAEAPELPSVLLDDDGARRFVMPVPDGWQAFDVDGLLALVRPDADTGWFRTNLTASRDLVPADADLATVMAECAQRVDDTYDATELRGGHEGRCGDALALVHLRAFDVRADAVRLSQMHAAFDAGIDGTSGARVVYQLIATCLADDAGTFRDAFATMIGSCRVTLSPVAQSPTGE